MDTLKVVVDGKVAQELTTYPEQIKENYDSWIRILEKEEKRTAEVTITWFSESGTITDHYPKNA